MSRSGSGTGRHIGRVLVTILSVMVLLTTVVGAGVSVVMGQLQGNITAIDVSENAGPVERRRAAEHRRRGDRHLQAGQQSS